MIYMYIVSVQQPDTAFEKKGTLVAVSAKSAARRGHWRTDRQTDRRIGGVGWLAGGAVVADLVDRHAPRLGAPVRTPAQPLPHLGVQHPHLPASQIFVATPTQHPHDERRRRRTTTRMRHIPATAAAAAAAAAGEIGELRAAAAAAAAVGVVVVVASPAGQPASPPPPGAGPPRRPTCRL
jgi:hypothetical protein